MQRTPARTVRTFQKASARAERKVLWDALVNSRYNKVLAARTLGISRSKLYRKLREPWPARQV